MKIDLTWGESVAVREQFIRLANADFNKNSLIGLNYAPFEGDPELLTHTRELILRQFGRTYKHVILTNGAAGGCVIAMRAFQQSGMKKVLTYEAPFFSLYPAMILAAGMEQIFLPKEFSNTIQLIDSPSNPEGRIRFAISDKTPVIWDAVYASKVYSAFSMDVPHDVLVGSYSKLTGLNGIRIGFIATDDSLLFDRIKDLVAAEYCGLSTPSIRLLNDILPDFPWEAFEASASAALDNNRGEFSKLEKFFDGFPVGPSGMFYYGPMDAACQRLIEKAGIIWTPGSRLGHTDDYGRFNIGQSTSVIQKAVASILKADKIS